MSQLIIAILRLYCCIVCLCVRRNQFSFSNHNFYVYFGVCIKAINLILFYVVWQIWLTLASVNYLKKLNSIRAKIILFPINSSISP